MVVSDSINKQAEADWDRYKQPFEAQLVAVEDYICRWTANWADDHRICDWGKMAAELLWEADEYLSPDDPTWQDRIELT